MEPLGLLVSAYCEIVTLGGLASKGTVLWGFVVVILLATPAVGFGTRSVAGGAATAVTIALLFLIVAIGC